MNSLEKAPSAGGTVRENANSSPLRLALERFNQRFGYSLACPILPEHVLSAATLAERRGRADIAQALRIALSENQTPHEHHDN